MNTKTAPHTKPKKIEHCVVYWCNALHPKEKVLPQVVEKILLQRTRCSILGQSKDETEMWDERLWTFNSKSFLAHGNDLKDHNPQDHPIWITQGFTNENYSQYGILTGYVSQNTLNMNLFNRWIWILMPEEKTAFQQATTGIQRQGFQESWVWKYNNTQWEKSTWILSSALE